MIEAVRGGRAVYRAVESIAAAHQGRVAVTAADGALTYAELNRRANRLASSLRARGVGADDRVAVLLPRRTDLAVALLAVHKAGAAYVPIDAEYPAERVRLMLEDSGARCVISRPDLVGLLPETLDETALVDVALGLDVDADATDPPLTAPLESLAYVIYTSGSSGRPKGAMIEHGALAAFVASAGERLGLTGADRVFGVNSIAFDLSVFDMFATLAHGATLHLASEADAREPAGLMRAIDAAAPTLMQATPATFRMLVLSGWSGRPGLRIVSSGDTMPPRLAHELHARGLDVWIGYGPTETTVWTNLGRWEPGQPIELGAPLPFAAMEVLDAERRPVAVGECGELWITGRCVARGYLGRPDLTAERFVALPGREGRWYRSGDLCRRDADGRLLFVGRADHQMKVRGYRVELGEVEAMLESADGVRQAVAAVFGEPSERYIVGYVTLSAVAGEGARAAESKRLRAELLARCPAHMVPTSIVVLDAMPMTPNRKVDRSRLPAPGAIDPPGAAVAAPVTATERALSRLFAEVLGVAGVARDDDFFALGGHSLVAVLLLVRIEEELGVAIPSAELFASPTVELLARRIDAVAATAGERGLAVVSRDGPLPLSFAQQRLWYLEQVERTDGAYHEPVAVRIRGEVDLDRLHRALRAVVDRHEALRTCFPAVAHVPSQWLHDADFPWSIVDLTSAPRSSEALVQRMRDEVGRPFDLERGPLLRAVVFRLAPRDHVLLLVRHHLIDDELSTRLVLDELGRAYAGPGDPRAALGAPLRWHHADFAAWERAWATEENLAPRLDYWAACLDEAPTGPPLPTDRRRPERSSYRGAVHAFEIDRRVGGAIDALARASRQTTFSVLLAAVGALLCRESGRSSVVVGVPTSQRRRRCEMAMAGFFLNMLPIRIDVERGATFRSFAARVHRSVLQAIEHEVPFERIVERVRPDRDRSHSPLFQVVFVWLEQDVPTFAVPGCSVEPVPVETGTSKFDLTVELRRTARGFAGRMEYAADLFEPVTIARLADRLVRFLRACSDDPTSALWSIDNREDDERSRRRGLTATDRPYPRDTPLDVLFRARAARCPTATAVIDGARAIDYRTLDRSSDRLAARLIAAGLGRGGRVALDLPRSLELVVGVLAVLKAGGSYVPLDVGTPPSRRRELAAAVGCVAVLVRGPGSGCAPDGTPVIDVLEVVGAGGVATATVDLADAGNRAEDEAYVMFTSGSTGVPRGVAVPHRAIVRLVHAQTYLPFDDRQVFLLHSNPSFDASTLELWGPLLHGSRLAIAPEVGPDLLVLGEQVRAHRVTCLWLTAGLFNAVIDEVPDALSGVGWIVTGGEALSVRHVRAALDRLDGTTIVNGYGPTECATFACTHRIPADLPPDAASVPIGRPLANTTVYLLDDELEPVPPGAVGELWIGGGGLALGYVGDERLTAERFRADPFAARPGARMYRTGDLARQLEDGSLEFHGRRDRQVKVRGIRVELGEVEANLLRLDSVGQAAVDVEGDAGDRRLVAYVTPGAARPSAEALREQLAVLVPRYLVPDSFVVLDALPRNANGKIDRAALSAVARCVHGHVLAEARTRTEQRVAAIWRDVLGLETVGIDDEFFDLGGHSLRAAVLMARVGAEFDVALPMATIQEASTVRGQARVVDAARSGPALPAIPRADRTRSIPLSFGQLRLWYLEVFESPRGAYNEPFALRIDGPLDPDRLRAVLLSICARHEVLRTTFDVDEDGEPRQVVHDRPELHWTWVDLAGASPADEALLGTLADSARRPFELRRGPLLRVLLIRLGTAEHVLQLEFHHTVVDDWTARLVLEELGRGYAAPGSPADALGPPLAVQYADFASWQRARVAGPELDRHLGYWQAHLRGAELLRPFPTDRPRPAVFSYRGAVRTVRIDAETTRRLGAFSRARRHGLFPTLLAATGAVLAGRAGRSAILLGTPFAQRRGRDEQAMAGFFLNLLPIQVDVAGEPSFAQLVDRVSADLGRAFEHADAPFESIVERVGPARSRGHAPLIQVVFVWLEEGLPTARFPGCRVRPLRASTGAAKFDLTVELRRDGDHIAGRLEYATDLFDESTIDAIGAQLGRVLVDGSAAPDLPMPAWAPPLAVHPGSDRASPACDPGAAVAIEPRRRSDAVPAPGLERALLDLWRGVLRAPDAGVDDDFFALGGHSLLAARLAARAGRELGVALPVNLVFEAPTVRRMAAALDDAPPADAFTTVAVQPRGTRPPVFFLPGLGGGAFVLPEISHELGTDQPIFALQAHPLRGTPTVEELGAACIRCIRLAQPSGPYRLAGFSLGGTIAFEAARQLRAAGEPVDALVIIDHAPPHVRWGIDAVRRAIGNLPYWLAELVRDPRSRDPRAFLERLRRAGRRLTGRARPPRAEDYADLSDWSSEMRTVAEQHLAAYRAYRPTPYPGPIVLVRARRQPLLLPTGRHFGWGPLAEGGVVERTVPGGHVSMLKGASARRLGRCLREALRPFDPAAAGGGA